jgi:hypothetical protein
VTDLGVSPTTSQPRKSAPTSDSGTVRPPLLPGRSVNDNNSGPSALGDALARNRILDLVHRHSGAARGGRNESFVENVASKQTQALTDPVNLVGRMATSVSSRRSGGRTLNAVARAKRHSFGTSYSLASAIRRTAAGVSGRIFLRLFVDKGIGNTEKI